MATKNKYKFSRISKKNLSECHPILQEIFNEVIKIIDCRVIEGYRPKEEQNKAYHAGFSDLRYPKSKHNRKPSLAADVIPYPVDWEDHERFHYFAGIVKGVAFSLGYKIRWGGDWKNNNSLQGSDLPHFELIGVRK